MCIFETRKNNNDYDISHLKLESNKKSYYMTIIHYG